MRVLERRRVLEQADADGQVFVVYRSAGRKDEERVDKREAGDRVAPLSECPGHRKCQDAYGVQVT